MRPQESYTRFIAVATGLTLAILVVFQIYIFREPGRIATDETRDKLIAETAGRSLYAENCAVCHGEQGEGVDGPALNDRGFLSNSVDDTIFSLISSGVPGSEMPAWNQAHGGPFTDQEIRQLVAYIRAWEAEAPDLEALAQQGDPVNGLTIYNSTCVVCHGENGQGTTRAPSLNDPVKLAQFDDDWYTDTIAAGRPAQGMPTWGTVLAPDQIRDLVALLRAWERGETVEPPGALEELAEALHLLEHGDLHAAEHALEQAAQGASGEVLAGLNAAMEAIEAGDQTAAEEAIHRVEELLGIQDNDAGEEGHDEGEDPHPEDSEG